MGDKNLNVENSEHKGNNGHVGIKLLILPSLN